MLLVSHIHQLRNLAADQISRVSKNLGAAFGVALNRSGNIILLQEHTPLGSGGFQQIETVLTQPICHFFIPAGKYFRFCHSFEPLSDRPRAIARESQLSLPVMSARGTKVIWRRQPCPSIG